MPAALTAAVDLDTVDDLLYFARTAALSDLRNAVAEAAAAAHVSQRAVLEAAVDADSGNSAIHMAAANGHAGR